MYKLKNNSNHKTSHTYIKTNIAYTSMQRKHVNANIHQHQRNTIIHLIYYVLANNLQYIRASMLSPPTSPPQKMTSKTSPLTNLSRREVPFAKDATYQGFIDLRMGRFLYDWGGELFFSLRRGIIFLIEEGNYSFIEGGLLEEIVVCIFFPADLMSLSKEISSQLWKLVVMQLLVDPWSSRKRDHYLGGCLE